LEVTLVSFFALISTFSYLFSEYYLIHLKRLPFIPQSSNLTIIGSTAPDGPWPSAEALPIHAGRGRSSSNS